MMSKSDEKMSESDVFFEANDGFKIFSKKNVLGVAIAGVLIMGPAFAATYHSATGAFLPKAEKTEKVSDSNNVRRHGWGGYYIGVYGGRSYMGGGSRGGK